MSTLKKFRFPVLIGAGVMAAGVLLYVSNTRVNSRLSQGAIGQRDVYRDGQVSSADVATPGAAPVASQVLLESKEFQALVKNEAFQSLMKDQAFARLAQNTSFLALLQNSRFQELLKDRAFMNVLQRGLSAEIISRLEAGTAQAVRQKSDADVQSLTENRAFQALRQDSSFLAFLKDQRASQALGVWGPSGSAPCSGGYCNPMALIQSSQFQNLLAQSSFRSALQSGLAAQLASGSAAQLSAGAAAQLSAGSAAQLSAGAAAQLSAGAAAQLSAGSAPKK